MAALPPRRKEEDVAENLYVSVRTVQHINDLFKQTGCPSQQSIWPYEEAQ